MLIVGKYKLKSRLCHHFLKEKGVLLSYNYETIRKVRNISLYYFSIKEKNETTHDTELVLKHLVLWMANQNGQLKIMKELYSL